MTTPRIAYEDEHVTLWHGDYRDVIPRYASVDLILADPPYAETSLAWDRWPDGWPTDLAILAASMWCFGSMRMFLDRRDEFAGPGWKLSQDVIWEKHNGSGFHADRFKRVHEHALHWYLGGWEAIRHEVPRVSGGEERRRGSTKRRESPVHTGKIGDWKATYVYDGTRLERSVIYAPSTHGTAIHPSQKPVGVLIPLIEYACAPGGIVLDPFAGSASTLVAARLAGRQAIGIEKRADYAKAAAQHLAQLPIASGIEPAARE